MLLFNSAGLGRRLTKSKDRILISFNFDNAVLKCDQKFTLDFFGGIKKPKSGGSTRSSNKFEWIWPKYKGGRWKAEK